MTHHPKIAIAMLACMVAGFAGAPSALRGADMPDSEAVSKLLAQAKTQSYGISVDAGVLESFTREPGLSWESHASEVTRMKNEINLAAKTLGALSAAKGQAAPWQVTAIDRIIPYLQEIATDTTNAIEYLNRNQSRLANNVTYRDYIEANADTSRELASLIAHFVDYGNHKNRYEGLRKSLELPGK